MPKLSNTLVSHLKKINHQLSEFAHWIEEDENSDDLEATAKRFFRKSAFSAEQTVEQLKGQAEKWGEKFLQLADSVMQQGPRQKKDFIERASSVGDSIAETLTDDSLNKEVKKIFENLHKIISNAITKLQASLTENKKPNPKR